MAEERRSILYPVLALIYLVAGTVFNGVIAAGLLDYEFAEPWVEFITDQRAEMQLAFLLLIAIGVLFLGFGVYLVSLNPFRLRRPRLLVYLNFLPFGFSIGILVMLAVGGGNDLALPAILAGIAVAAVIPLFFLLMENVLGRVLLSLGRRFDESGSSGPAYLLLKNSLRWRPGDPETTRRCGLLLADLGRTQPARRLLERCGEDVETTEDIEVLRAYEQVYTVEGEHEKALDALRRQRELRPNLRTLEERYLKQALALKHWDEAIRVLESRPGPLRVEHVAQLHELYLKSGNVAQAMARARQVAQMEDAPYSRAIALHEALLDRMPNNIEVRIDLGALLLKSGAEGTAERGAAHLERALRDEPHRLQVRRLIARHYMEAVQTEKAEEHFRTLIEQGDPDPETYLDFASMLKSEDRREEAEQVYLRMQEVCDTDWRGFFELAAMKVTDQDLDQADRLLKEADALAGDENKGKLNRLRQQIGRAREEQHLRSLSERATREGAEIEERLNYIRQLIRLDKTDRAVTETDLLLEEHPDRLPQIMEVIEEGIRRAEHPFRLQDYLSDLYFRQGRYDDMLKLHQQMAERSLHPAQNLEDGCKKILSRAPEHLPTRLVLSRLYLDTSNWKGVLNNFRSAPEGISEEDRLTLQEHATYAARRAGKLQDALQYGNEVLPHRQDDPDFLIEMIGLLEEAGDAAQAHQLYQQARERFPNSDRLIEMEHKIAVRERRERLGRLQEMSAKGELSPEQHFEMAELHRLFKEYQDAIAHYQQAAEDENLHDLSVAKMAVCLCERGMYELADETLDSIELTKDSVRRHPEMKNLFYRVGDALDSRNFKAEALKYFKRLFQVDASFRDVVTRLERLGGSI